MKIHHLGLQPCQISNKETAGKPPEDARVIDEGLLVLGDRNKPSQSDEFVGMIAKMRPEAYEPLLLLTPWLDSYQGWSGERARLSGISYRSQTFGYTAPLPYHRDSGNVNGSWSAMITLRQDVGGGMLHLPELDSYLKCEDMSVAIFNGQQIMHGVTPLQPMTPRGKRYTIVFYAKAAFAGREQPEDELKRAQAAATIEPSTDEVYEVKRKEQRDNPLRFNIRAGTSDKKTVEEVIEGNGYQKPRKGFLIEPGDRWLDGGVNIGAFTCWAHRLGVQSVVGFEAEADNYEAAKQNLALNAVPFEIRHQAIMPDSHEGDSVTLYKCDELGKEWRHSTQWQRKKSTPVKVPAIRFSDALDLAEADCVKLDIEGAEIPMLVEQSFPFDRIRKLAFEWSFDVERRIPVLREVLDRVEASFPNVALSRKIDWSAETFDWFPPQVLVFAWR